MVSDSLFCFFLLISCVSDSLFCFLIRVSEFSVAWGKRGEGGQGREGV